MLELKTPEGGIKAAVAAMPRDELFSVDGVAYTIPVKFPPIVALTYGRMKLKFGDDLTVAWALDLALGDEGMAALLATDPPEAEVVKITAVILARIQGLAAGLDDVEPMADPKANRAARRKGPAKKAG